MPNIAEIEPTPNPNARKFVLKEPLTAGVPRSYENSDAAKEDPLAAALFAIAHVTNVYYQDRWLTVTQDGGADWTALLKQLAVPIRAASAQEVSRAGVAAQTRTLPPMNEADEARLQRINTLLDERIRPYLVDDGGGLDVVGLHDERLLVHYQGACGTCPTSLAGTLNAIQNLLRTIEPELEVVAV
jgi:Fe-S cluster biogenesis protein NfuA